jgi:pSer/pThr/pTyr-binding forkhead associated (FHA) protein
MPPETEPPPSMGTPEATTPVAGSPAAASFQVPNPPTATPPAGSPAVTGEPQENRKPGVERTLGPGAGVRGPGADSSFPPARLVAVRRDGTDGERYELFEESFDIGRRQGQLTFEEDPYLSERHCRLSVRAGKWLIEDLNSRNGIYSRIVKPYPLGDGDLLLFGKQVMAFVHISDEELDMAPAVEHGVMVFGSPLRKPWGRLMQLTVAGVHRDVYHLYRPQLTLGREEGDLTFPDDEFMSRKHMAVSEIDGKVTVQDLGSSNGTFIRVRGSMELSSGDTLRIGDQLLRFELV